MSSIPRVSVVIPAFNAERYLADALGSVGRQTYRDLEVVVADDGSTDRTAEIAGSFASVRVLRLRNGGPASARNAGVAATSGELVAFLDADDDWLPEKLEETVKALDASPDAPLVTSLDMGWDGRPSGRDVPLQGPATVTILRDSYVDTSSVVVRRAALERAGGFDTDPRLISVEDWDLWLRISLLGPFAGVARRLVRRRLHEGSLAFDTVRLRERMIHVLDKFETLVREPGLRRELAHARATLRTLIGRAYLSRADVARARPLLRAALHEAPDASLRAHALALLGLSLLPRRALAALHDARERNRRRAAG